jgi:hypothetical protein
LLNLVDETASILDTQSDAEAVLAAALADMAAAPVVMRVEQLFDPRVQLGQLIRWQADGRRMDENVDGAVVGFTHVLERDVHRTTIETRQAPTGSPQVWVDMGSLVPKPPARDVWYEDPTRQNLLLVPGNNIGLPIQYPNSYSVPLEYIRRVVDVGSGVSGSIRMIPSAPTVDSWRPAIWFTDANGNILDRTGHSGSPAIYTGSLHGVGTTAGEGTGRINGANIPQGTVYIHVGVVVIGSLTGTITLERPMLHRGAWGGLYTGSDAQVEQDVSLSGFGVQTEDSNSVTYEWTRGIHVEAIHVWERTSLPWPSKLSSPDVSLGQGTDEYEVAKPTSGKKYIQFVTESPTGERFLEQQEIVQGNISVLEFTGQIKQSPVSVGGSENYATDLAIDVSGDSGAFPLQAEIRIESKDGLVIAAHTFSGPGTITKSTASGLGARPASEIGWWLKLTSPDGRVRWVDTVNRLLNLGTEEFSGLIGETKISSGSITTPKLAANSVTAIKVAAGAITASKIDVSTLSAITANLGTVVIGDSGEGTIRLMEGGAFSGSVSAGSSGSIVGLRLARTASITIGVDVSVPESAINISASSLYLPSGTHIGGDEISKGANDSAGAGWRVLRVPNS